MSVKALKIFIISTLAIFIAPSLLFVLTISSYKADYIGDIKPASVSDGYNLYANREYKLTVLMDNYGKVVQAWNMQENFHKSKKLIKSSGIHIAKLDEQGSLFVVYKDESITKYNLDSSVEWTAKGKFHHDLSFADNGDIYALSRKVEDVRKRKKSCPILNDYVNIISSEGKVKERVPIFPIIKRIISNDRFLWACSWGKENLKTAEKITDTPIDLMHTNSIQVIKEDYPGLAQQGDLLISMKYINTIAIIDIKERKLRWSFGPGILEHQHHPTLINGNELIVFDNGVRRKYSRILSINPRTKKIEWEYNGKPDNGFYTTTRGSMQKLENGNYLFAVSDTGTAMEVTPEKEVVWRFTNPVLLNDKPASYSRIERLELSHPFIRENYRINKSKNKLKKLLANYM